MSATVRIVVEWDGTTIEITNQNVYDNVTFSSGGTASMHDISELLDDAYRRATEAVFAKPEERR